jgi:hypothetical protein
VCVSLLSHAFYTLHAFADVNVSRKVLLWPQVIGEIDLKRFTRSTRKLGLSGCNLALTGKI